MKTNRFITLLAAGAVWAGLSASAFTQTTVIRIVASNGDRTATQTAIAHILTGSWTYQGVGGSISGTGGPGAVPSVATGSNFGAWNGTYDGQQVVIKTSFSGALAGIAAIAGNTDQRFVATDGTGLGAVANPLTSSNPAEYEIAKADFGFSTNFQSTSPFNGVFQGVTYSPVIEELVGISPLGFYASPGFPGSPNSSNPSFVPNITTQLARQLYTQGVIPLAHFTGDWTNDKDKTVWAIGRNTDAGQRFGAYTEIGLGTTTQVRVWFPTLSGTTAVTGGTKGGTVTKHELWPVTTQPGTFAVPLGSGGYNSGANLASVLTTTLTADAFKGKLSEDEGGGFLFPTATAGYYIGYVTPGDANPRILGSPANPNNLTDAQKGVALTFNGVALTEANVKNGTYTAWLYNRILKPQSGLTGSKLTFANALRNQIRDFDATAGGGLIDDATVFVKRSTDGGDVVPK